MRVSVRYSPCRLKYVDRALTASGGQVTQPRANFRELYRDVSGGAVHAAVLSNEAFEYIGKSCT